MALLDEIIKWMGRKAQAAQAPGTAPWEKPEADRWKRFNPNMAELPFAGARAGQGPAAVSAPAVAGAATNPRAAGGEAARNTLLGWFRNPGGSQAMSPREQANQDNEQRYMQAMMALGEFGRGERARLTENDLFAQARIKQQLTNRGLGQSSVIGPMMQGVQRQTNMGYMDLAERMAARKIGLLQSKEATYQDSATRPLEEAAYNEGYAEAYRRGG